MGNIPIIIRNARLSKGLSQKELAVLIGKTKNVISNWENGRHKPNADQIESLCGILDIPVSDMFPPKQKENRTSPERHSPVGTRKDDRLITLWRQLPYDEQLIMLGRIQAKIEECATSEEQGNFFKNVEEM